MHPTHPYYSQARAREGPAPGSLQQMQMLPAGAGSFSQMVLANNQPVMGLHASPAAMPANPSNLAWRQMQHVQSTLTLPQYQDEIDSDELEESDEEGNEDVDQPAREEADDQPVHYDTTDYDYINDDELYENFIQQYILTNEEGEASNLLHNDETDEDDEEDYEPDESESDGDDDDDQDDDDLEADGNRVQKKELRELLNDCWLTIADADITLPEYDYSDRDSNNTFPSTASQPYYDEHRAYGYQDPHPTDAAYMSPRPASANSHGVPGHFSPNKEKHKANANLVSSFVTQVFAGNKPSEICIDGVPVGAIRKVVARQMSMSLQLLIQILFLAENRSECWKLAYSSLLHLTNLRESAVKKAALLQMNMENVAALRNFNVNEKQNGMLRNNEYKQLFDEVRPHLMHGQHHGQPRNNGNTQDILGTNDLYNHVGVANKLDNQNVGMNRRMTRSTLINYNSRSNRTSSIFDIPVLFRIGDLMMRIDHASKRINRFKQTQLRSSTPLEAVAPTVAAMTALTNIDASERHKLLAYCEKEVEEICHQLPIKAWQCLIPKANYPFRESYPFQNDASSVTGQTHFSPAEDDLLLRGILSFGENAWDSIRALLLPSKDPQLLYYRYCQQTMINSNLEYNDFKRFKHLASQRIKKRHREDRWSLAEDLNLLRGYEIFGEKWPLVVMFFLPHLKISDVRIRWGLMQKIWNKAFPNVHHGNWIMTPGVKAFLSDLHHCSSFKDLKDFAECGGVELRKLNDTNYNDQSNAKAALGMDPITERLVDAYDHSMFDQDELSDSDKEDEPSFSNRGISLNPAAAMYPMYNQAAIVTSVPSFQPPSGTSLPASNRMATAVPNKRVSFAEQVNPMDMSAYGSVASHPSTMLNPQNVMNYTVNPYHNPALMAMNPILTADALTGPLLLNRFPDDGNTDQHKSSKKRAYAGIKNRGNVYSEANQVTTELPVSKKASRAELRPSQDSMIDLTASNSLAPSVSQSSKVHKPQNLPNGKSAAVNLETEKESAHSHEDTNRSEIVGPEMDFSLGGFSNIMGMSLMKAPTNASRIDDTMDHSSKEKDDSRSNGTMSSVSRLSAEGIFAQVTAGGIKRA